MNDTTFHSLSLFPKRTCAQKVPRVVSKNTNAWFFSHHAREREGVLSLFLSLFSSRRISSKAARVTIRSSSQNPRERRQNFKRRLYTKRTFFILDLRFNDIDGIRRLHFQGDGFARQGFHENLHLLRLLLVLICVTCLCVYFLVARVNF